MESGCEQILKITDRILDGGEITEEEAKALIRATDEDTMLLLACADKIRQKFSGRSVDLCAIVNARSGRCQEDCKFCAQSARYDTGIDNYTFLPEEEVMKAAQKAKEAGAARFDIVTAGRDQRNPKFCISSAVSARKSASKSAARLVSSHRNRHTSSVKPA